MEQLVTRRKTTKKKSRRVAEAPPRPAIEPTRLYHRREAALVCGVSQVTLFRAYDSGNLKAYRVGSRIQHSGQHLLDWLEAGGRTGRTVEHAQRERAEK